MGLDFQHSEGQALLDEEEKLGLKIKSIATHGELDEFEQLNIENALEWTIRGKFKTERILSEMFVKQLHIKMYGDVWKWAGEFRKSDKNIGFSWTLISSALSILLDDTKYWVENKTFEPEEIAIRFKHKIVSIHCFSNGNGRHSRMMADIIMESIFSRQPFLWHQSNMVNADAIRTKYIQALKKADNGDFKPLLAFAQH